MDGTVTETIRLMKGERIRCYRCGKWHTNGKMKIIIRFGGLCPYATVECARKCRERVFDKDKDG